MVVMIIGIIAAIAIPRLARASASARDAALRRDLGALRSAIEIYANEHNGVFPGNAPDGQGNNAKTAEAAVNQLTLYSNADGEVSTAHDAAHTRGPYLARVPEAPVGVNKGSRSIAIDVANSPPAVTSDADGWVYNPVTGEIIVNSSESNDANTRTFDAY